MANSRITVGDLRTALNRETFKADTFVSQVNKVSERLTYNAKYKGNVIYVTIQPSQSRHFITLPYQYLSALGSTYNHWPTPIFGQFHTYFEGGPGTPIETTGWAGQLQDMGDGFCTQDDIIQANTDVTPNIAAQPGSIVVYSTGSDNGKTIRLFGIEEETGTPVCDPSGVEGEQLTLNAPFVTSTKHYSQLTDAIKPRTNGPLAAWVAPTGGGTNYQIATWLQFETRPRYRRYYVGTTTRAVQILAQRRFMIVRDETDWVLPGCVAAYDFGIMALNHESSGYTDEARENWADAIRWANEEATASRGGAQPSIPAGVFGWGDGGIPNTH